MPVVLRVRKFLNNKVLARRQMIVDVIHTNQACIPKKEIKDLIAKKYKVDERNVVLFGFDTIYGGGKTTGFCLIYNNYQYLLKYEPKHRLRSLQILPKQLVSRKGRKELKGKCLRTRGKEISKLKVGKVYGPGDYKQMLAKHLLEANK